MLVEDSVGRVVAEFVRDTALDSSPVLLSVSAQNQGYVPRGATVTDAFTLTASGAGQLYVEEISVVVAGYTPVILTDSTDAQPGNVPGAAPAVAVTLSLTGSAQTYTDVPALNAALAAATTTTATVDVTYAPAAAENGDTIVVALAAQLRSSDSTYPDTVIAESSAIVSDSVLHQPPFAVLAQPAITGAVPGATVSDSFSFTNISPVAGRFSFATPIIGGPVALNAAGYTATVASSAGVTLATQTFGAGSTGALNAWLALNGPYAPGTVVTIGVAYIGPDAANGQAVFTQLAATFTAQAPSNAFVPADLTSTATPTVIDPITPVPLVTVTAATPSTPPITVLPGMTTSDAFVLTNASGQAATVTVSLVELHSVSAAAATTIRPYGASLFTGFTATAGSIVVSAQTLGDLNKNLATLPLLGGATLTIEATYTVPDGTPGDSFVDTLTATATAGGVPQTLPAASATVTKTLGALGDILTAIVSELDAQYEQKWGAATATTLEALLKSADAQVAQYVNDPAGAKGTSSDLARALAIHDLFDDLYERLIKHDGPPPRIDIVP